MGAVAKGDHKCPSPKREKEDEMSSTSLLSLREFTRLDHLLEEAGMHHFCDQKQQAVRDKAAQVLIEQFEKHLDEA